MAQFTDQLTPELRTFIARQPIFFTGSALATGRINVSPKGMDTFRALDDRTVGYLDITGSGNETSAHLAHDGRLTIMFCSFDSKPLILRLYGRGEVIRPGSERWAAVSPRFPSLAGERQIILLPVDSVQTSCGFGVPKMELVEPRQMLLEWATKKGAEGIKAYQQKKNRQSIDGLPVDVGPEASGT